MQQHVVNSWPSEGITYPREVDGTLGGQQPGKVLKSPRGAHGLSQWCVPGSRFTGPMGTYGGLWGLVGAYSDLWGPMGAYGDLWGPLGTYVCP